MVFESGSLSLEFTSTPFTVRESIAGIPSFSLLALRLGEFGGLDAGRFWPRLGGGKEGLGGAAAGMTMTSSRGIPRASCSAELIWMVERKVGSNPNLPVWEMLLEIVLPMKLVAVKRTLDGNIGTWVLVPKLASRGNHEGIVVHGGAVMGSGCGFQRAQEQPDVSAIPTKLEKRRSLSEQAGRVAAGWGRVAACCRAACESVTDGDLTTRYGRGSTSTCPSQWARLADRAPLAAFHHYQPTSLELDEDTHAVVGPSYSVAGPSTWRSHHALQHDLQPQLLPQLHTSTSCLNSGLLSASLVTSRDVVHHLPAAIHLASAYASCPPRVQDREKGPRGKEGQPLMPAPACALSREMGHPHRCALALNEQGQLHREPLARRRIVEGLGAEVYGPGFAGPHLLLAHGPWANASSSSH
ncbi:hypothetical protein C8F04DRAFT_1315099 [Mycena alexandri]|uniref:Uncharacterized protein n=1 Tax=Mycena alexandri TaxID=1745969 RepID=A0AAD6T6W5_9AGAR|nr:hypothetical protein C8F04DRAFT_1315099 [Mycena alexandri]